MLTAAEALLVPEYIHAADIITMKYHSVLISKRLNLVTFWLRICGYGHLVVAIAITYLQQVVLVLFLVM